MTIVLLICAILLFAHFYTDTFEKIGAIILGSVIVLSILAVTLVLGLVVFSVITSLVTGSSL